MTDQDEHANDHADCDADVCFTAKMRYWRGLKHGAPINVPPIHQAVRRARKGRQTSS